MQWASRYGEFWHPVEGGWISRAKISGYFSGHGCLLLYAAAVDFEMFDDSAVYSGTVEPSRGGRLLELAYLM